MGLINDTEFWRSATLLLATAGQSLFILLYALLPWYASHLGRALFFKGASLLSILLLGTVGRLTDTPIPDVVFTLLYVVLTIGVWWQVLAFLKVVSRNEDLDDG